jgi:hypothetical protein
VGPTTHNLTSPHLSTPFWWDGKIGSIWWIGTFLPAHRTSINRAEHQQACRDASLVSQNYQPGQVLRTTAESDSCHEVNQSLPRGENTRQGVQTSSFQFKKMIIPVQEDGAKSHTSPQDPSLLLEGVQYLGFITRFSPLPATCMTPTSATLFLCSSSV